MDAPGILAKFERTYATWREVIERTDAECFAKDLGAGQWTLGQACDHVTGVSLAFLEKAQAMANGEGEVHSGGLMPLIAFEWIGSLPPVRFKVPENLPPEYAHFARPESIDKGETIRRFEQVAEQQRALCQPVAATNPKMRMKHPAAGWLTAKQWYRGSEMHMRHHLRQLRRIEQKLD